MPLPPLPDNNTDRSWLQYTMMGTQHELCLRWPNATTQATVIAQNTALANALKPYMSTADSFTGLRHSDGGSNLSFPLAWTSIVGTNSGTPETDDESKFMALSGRSLGGYRCKTTFFTPFIGDVRGYRVAVGIDSACDALYNGILALTPDPVSKDGQSVIWNAYINIGYNSYWQRQLR